MIVLILVSSGLRTVPSFKLHDGESRLLKLPFTVISEGRQFWETGNLLKDYCMYMTVYCSYNLQIFIDSRLTGLSLKWPTSLRRKKDFGKVRKQCKQSYFTILKFREHSIQCEYELFQRHVKVL